MLRKLKKLFVKGPVVKKRLPGFTLTEVMVAAVLLLIALVPILKALTISNFNSGAIERKTRSLALAQAKLNEIEARSIYNYDGTFTENNTSLGGSYLCKVVDATVSSNLRTITVSVGYDSDHNGVLSNSETEISLVTSFARRS